MGDQMMLADYEMLESLYDFNATFTKTLTFSEGERFLLQQTNSKQRNWWQVINRRGEVGFVPSNYVSVIKVEPETIISFVDECLKSLRSDSPISSQTKDLVARLKEKKRNVQMSIKSTSKKPPAPQPPEPLSPVFDLRPIVSEQNLRESFEPVKDKIDQDITVYHIATSKGDTAKSLPSKSSEHLKSPHNNLSSPTTSADQANIMKQHSDDRSDGSRSDRCCSAELHDNGDQQDDVIQPNAIYKIVQSVREKTQLSHDLSKVAVETVLISLKEFLPGGAACSIVDALLREANSNVTCPKSALDASPDALRMVTALDALSKAANDAQQRGWSLHDDAHDIQTQLLELISVMSNADVNISQHVLSSHKYGYVIVLVQYYQMETRWPLRQLLLQAFGVMCGLERTALATLAVSPLPAEIARDMMDNPRAVTRLSHSALLLSMVLSMGDRLPVTHFEQLGVEFAQFLLELMESPPETDVDEQVPDLFLTLLLAYNLQFHSPHENLLLDALQSRDTAKTFTEKVLLLLNREDDPVRIFDHEPAPPNSVLKLAIDLFQRRPTADHFYTNDVRVMIDIVVRNLADLSAGDPRREKYLRLCGGIVRNTDYGSHLHRREDLLRCFARIFCEESDASRADQALCRAISNEFPHYFKA